MSRRLRHQAEARGAHGKKTGTYGISQGPFLSTARSHMISRRFPSGAGDRFFCSWRAFSSRFPRPDRGALADAEFDAAVAAMRPTLARPPASSRRRGADPPTKPATGPMAWVRSRDSATEKSVWSKGEGGDRQSR